MSLAECDNRNSMEGRRRITLLDRMSPLDDGRSSFGRLTLDAFLEAEKTATSANTPTETSSRPHRNRTLLEIIKGESRELENGDKRTWRSFREKLRPKRAAGNRTTSESPTRVGTNQRFDQQESLIYLSGHSGANTSRGLALSSESMRRSSLAEATDDVTRSLESFLSNSDEWTGGLALSVPTESTEPLGTYISNPIAPNCPNSDEPTHSSAPSGSQAEANHHDTNATTREPTLLLGLALAEERAESAREAEAAAVAASVTGATSEAEPVRMALIDLLEETDRHVGTVWSRHAGEDERGYDVLADVASAEGTDDVASGGGGVSCCVCMVRSKGAAFIPCGHTFCRLCSRELWVRRGNCPLCNAVILEILDIF